MKLPSQAHGSKLIAHSSTKTSSQYRARLLLERGGAGMGSLTLFPSPCGEGRCCNARPGLRSFHIDCSIMLNNNKALKCLITYAEKIFYSLASFSARRRTEDEATLEFY